MPSWLTPAIIVLGVALLADLRRNDADELTDVFRRGTSEDQATRSSARTSATFSRTVIVGRCLARAPCGGPGRTSASTAEATLRRSDTAGTDQASAVARLTESDDLHSPAGLRGVHHPAPSEIEAHVSEAIEEEDVARLHAGRRHAPAFAVQRVGVVRKVDPDATVRPADEP